jgi:hypothetical protein
MCKLYCFVILALLASIVSQASCTTCLKTNTAVTCTPTSSSSYYGYSGYWGPQFAVDQATSYSNTYFFHSHYEAYAWLKIQLSAASTVNAVVLRTRCDANQWWHYQDLEARTHTADITAIPGIVGASWPTPGTLCTNFQYTYWYQCGSLTKACAAAAASTLYATIQQKTLDSHGGGWGQHSNVMAYFLMLNEVEFY